MKKGFLPVLFLLLLSSRDASAQDATVVELFTSQSCSSCPPADAYLNTLAERPDIIALGYHVDYWNRTLTFSGSWRDPFSLPEWTARQKTYAGLISGAGNPYTPQMVIDGKFAGVGSDKETIEKLIEKAKQARDKMDFVISQKRVDATASEVTLKGGLQGHGLDIVLARFHDRAETNIKSGENKGMKIVNRHIVKSLTTLGTWYGAKQTFRFATGQGIGCAILLQDKVDREIAAAVMCQP